MTDNIAMSVNTNPWIENTGTIPDGIGTGTVIEVEYRDGLMMQGKRWNSQYCWTIYHDKNDIIRWRFAQ